MATKKRETGTEPASLIWEKVRYRLKQMGLSQTALAKQVGVYDERMSQWLNGTGWPNLMHIRALSVALNVSMSYLVEDAIPVDKPATHGEPPSGLSDDERLLMANARKIGIDLALSRVLGVPTIGHESPTVGRR